MTTAATLRPDPATRRVVALTGILFPSYLTVAMSLAVQIHAAAINPA